MKRVNLYLRDEVLEELDREAQKQGVSRSELMRRITAEYLMRKAEDETASRLNSLRRELRDEIKKQAERLSKIAVKAALYSIATRAELNSLLYDIADDKEEAERQIEAAWKFAVEQLKKDEWL